MHMRPSVEVKVLPQENTITCGRGVSSRPFRSGCAVWEVLARLVTNIGSALVLNGRGSCGATCWQFAIRFWLGSVGNESGGRPT
jgi:hypothetical protein